MKYSTKVKARRTPNLPPAEVDHHLREHLANLLRGQGMTSHQANTASVLFSASRPMMPTEIRFACSVPRTKTYSTLRKLVEIGAATIVRVVEEDTEKAKPDIYPYWPDKRISEWKRSMGLGATFYAACPEWLAALMARLSAEYQDRALILVEALDRVRLQPELVFPYAESP